MDNSEELIFYLYKLISHCIFRIMMKVASAVKKPPSKKQDLFNETIAGEETKVPAAKKAVLKKLPGSGSEEDKPPKKSQAGKMKASVS